MSEFLEHITERAETALKNLNPVPETEKDDVKIAVIIVLLKAFERGAKSEIIYRNINDENDEIHSVLTDKSGYYWEDKKGDNVKIHAVESILDDELFWTISEAIPVSGMEELAEHHNSKELRKINKFSKKLAPLNRKKLLSKMVTYEKAGGRLSFPDRIVQVERDVFDAVSCKLELLKSAMPPRILAEVDSLFSTYDVSSDSEKRNTIKILKTLVEFEWLACFGNPNIEDVKATLDESHACLDSTKEALVEELVCVNADSEHVPQPIVLIGKSGNGKRSLVESFAKGIGKISRTFSAASLDDAIELRGSSRNYDNAQPSRLFYLCKEVGPHGILVIDRPEEAKSKECVASLQALLSEKVLNDVFIGAPIPLNHMWFFVLVNDIDHIPAWCSSYKRITIPDYTESELEDIVTNKLIPRYTKRFGVDKFILSKKSIKTLIDLSLYRSVKGIEENLKKVICRALVEGIDLTTLRSNQIFDVFYSKEKQKRMMADFAKDEIALEEKYIICRYKNFYYADVMERCEKLFMRLSSGDADEVKYAKDVLQLLVNTLKSKSTTTVSVTSLKENLDRSHCGLEEVKGAAMLSLKKAQMTVDGRITPILLVGPPGSGKTSVVKSIASGLKMGFGRIFCNTLADGGDLIGVQGVKPGRIIKILNAAGTYRVLILLDEIDKLSVHVQNAVLSLLDSSGPIFERFCQTHIDVSQIFFVGTANSVQTMSEALLDRFKVIRIEGYSALEKEKVVKEYILPEVKKDLNLKKLNFTQEAIVELVSHCGLDGCRDLRPATEEVILKNPDKIKITKEDVILALGNIESKRKVGF